MAGGIFTSQNKLRPGAYINVKSKNSIFSVSDKKGVVLMPLFLDYGVEKKPILVQSNEDIITHFGSLSSLTLPISEALKVCSGVLVYRINSGTTSSFSLNPSFSVTSKESGVDANLLSLSIEEVPGDKKFLVSTFFKDSLLLQESVDRTLSSYENLYVSIQGALRPKSRIFLTAGSSSSPSVQDYLDFFAVASTLSFDVLSMISTDTSILESTISFVKRMREEEGKKIVAVIPNYPNADYEGIITVKNGVVLSDGTTLSPAVASAFVAGASAAAPINHSNTYFSYPGAISPSPILSHTETITALEEGFILFSPSSFGVVIEKDINSFVSFSPEKNSGFSKNRTLRVLDTLSNDIATLFHKSYIGKVSSNKDGRHLLKGDLINYLENLQQINAIQDFQPNTDLFILQGEQSDSVEISLSIQPVDSVEKLYLTITVN